jgi:uncharacterized protein
MSRRQLLLLTHGLTGSGHVLFAAGLAVVVPWRLAVGVALGVWLATAFRLHALRRDPRRPVWVVRLLDEPMFCHWSACIFALALFPIAGLACVIAFLLGFGSVPGAAQLALGCSLFGALLAAFAIWVERRRVVVREFELPLAKLGSELSGYRVVQLSDLHIGSFDPKERGRSWVDRANLLDPDLVVVTGDLVTVGTHWYEDVAEVLGQLRARDGVFACLGNHDQWDPKRLTALLEARGVSVLENAWRSIRRGPAALVIAGLGDRYTQRDDLEATLKGRPEDAPTVLLAHYPQSFEAAAERGVELVLSGHTHGGQAGVPPLAERYNVATLSGQRARGFFRRGSSVLYVNAGLGTTGPPLRLGIRPEIALFVLLQAES